jgi:SAM-dependent methyltransferase
MAGSICRICENIEGNPVLIAREFMFGTEDRFEYFQCGVCGCLQIAVVPENLADYYPSDYYSFGPAPRETGMRRYLQRKRAEFVLGGCGLVGRLVTARYGIPETLDHIRRAGVSYDDPVLEIGSGSGERLLAMNSYGFSDITGIDPYVARSFDPAPGVRILKQELSVHEGTYSFVMLHHTFEHMDHPHAVVGDVCRLLEPGKTALVRIPLASSLAFRNYGADWVQLDAPRHLYLHTVDSMKRVAEKAGLEITDVVYDSTAFQFWGSEQYRSGIPLRDSRSYAMNPSKSQFAPADIKEFEREAARLNDTGEGDQACFYLRKPLRQ